MVNSRVQVGRQTKPGVNFCAAKRTVTWLSGSNAGWPFPKVNTCAKNLLIIYWRWPTSICYFVGYTVPLTSKCTQSRGLTARNSGVPARPWTCTRCPRVRERVPAARTTLKRGPHAALHALATRWIARQTHVVVVWLLQAYTVLARIRTSAWCTLYSHLPTVNDTRFRGQDKITPGLPASLPRVLVHLLVSGTVNLHALSPGGQVWTRD